jgi:hypothetical protein
MTMMMTMMMVVVMIRTFKGYYKIIEFKFVIAFNTTSAFENKSHKTQRQIETRHSLIKHQNKRTSELN